VATRTLRIALVLIGGLSLTFQACQALAESVVLTSVADTTLLGAVPDNNNGGQIFVNAGVTQNYTTNRGLYRFDIGAQIPAGSKITHVDLRLEVVRQPPSADYHPAAFNLHRLLASWGEGNKTNSSSVTSPSIGLGEPATANEATWNARLAFTTNRWTIPGGAASNDYSPSVSSSQFVYGVGDSPYIFGPTPAMIADVQMWLDLPQTNFGWLLKSDDETVNWTACGFGSRENAQNTPLLTIEYEPPQIDRVQLANNQLTLSFTAQAEQDYVVEFRDSPSTLHAWSTLTNFAAQPASTNIVVSDPITDGLRFYRLRLP
jgi:hypothetical protein